MMVNNEGNFNGVLPSPRRNPGISEQGLPPEALQLRAIDRRSALWSILAVFMLCFQSCSTAVPVTACTSVSFNTGTSQPTALPAHSNMKLYLSEKITAASPD